MPLERAPPVDPLDSRFGRALLAERKDEGVLAVEEGRVVTCSSYAGELLGCEQAGDESGRALHTLIANRAASTRKANANNLAASWPAPTRTAPEPISTALDSGAGRLGFRYSDILVWDTNQLIVNAGVTGSLPWFRYVLLSDALIERIRESRAGGSLHLGPRQCTLVPLDAGGRGSFLWTPQTETNGNTALIRVTSNSASHTRLVGAARIHCQSDQSSHSQDEGERTADQG